MRPTKRSDAIFLLGLEHERIGQVLDILDQQIDLMEHGSESDSELLELAVEYFLTFPDTCHHPKEDLLFRQMRKHSSDDTTFVGDLIRDHLDLSQLTNNVSEMLGARTAGSPLTKDALDELKVFLKSYRDHLQTENVSFFPHLLQTLSQEELDIVDFSLFDASDPVFIQQTEERFSQLRDEILRKSSNG